MGIHNPFQSPMRIREVGACMSTKVGDVMVQNVKTVSSEDTVSQAVRVMNRHEIGCVIVTNDKKPVGILTERDVLKRIVFGRKDPAETKVGQVMSEPLVKVSPDSNILDATQLMLKNNIKKLVVANRSRLLGILSLTDLLPLLEAQGATDKLLLKKVPDHVKKAFQIYYDPVRQLRKTCPLTMARDLAISCLGFKCMWYVGDRCGFLKLIEKISN